MTSRILLIAVMFVTAYASPLLAASDYSSIGGTYSQNFNSLAASDGDYPWTNDSTIVGWHLFRVTSGTDATPFAMTAYDASNGSADFARFYSFGNSADRALGGIGHTVFGYTGDQATSIQPNQPAGWIAASIANNTGTQLTQFTLAYDGEQWRDAGDNEPPYAQTMQFEYGFGSSFSSVSTWTAPGGNFNFTSPVFTTTAGPVDGNNAGRGGTIMELARQSGTTLWLRWVERNDDPAFDHGLAIDSVSFSANISAVPEASVFWFAVLICGLTGLMYGVRKLRRRAATSTA